jgi:chromosome segregation ATPase
LLQYIFDSFSDRDDAFDVIKKLWETVSSHDDIAHRNPLLQTPSIATNSAPSPSQTSSDEDKHAMLERMDLKIEQLKEMQQKGSVGSSELAQQYETRVTELRQSNTDLLQKVNDREAKLTSAVEQLRVTQQHLHALEETSSRLEKENAAQLHELKDTQTELSNVKREREALEERYVTLERDMTSAQQQRALIESQHAEECERLKAAVRETADRHQAELSSEKQHFATIQQQLESALASAQQQLKEMNDGRAQQKKQGSEREQALEARVMSLNEQQMASLRDLAEKQTKIGR